MLSDTTPVRLTPAQPSKHASPRLASSYLHPSSVPIVENYSNPRLIKDHLHHVNSLTQRTHKTAQDFLPLIYTVKGGRCQ